MSIKLLKLKKVLHSQKFQLLNTFTLLLFFTFNLSSQSTSQVLNDWTVLEEATFLVDTSYQIVKVFSRNTIH